MHFEDGTPPGRSTCGRTPTRHRGSLAAGPRMTDDACVSNGRKRRAGSSVWTWTFPRRRPHGPRRRDLLKQREYWLRAGEVPKARVEVDPASESRFDEFDVFRAQHTRGQRFPVELYVLLKRDGPHDTQLRSSA